jgi:hypothetical protein
MEGEVFCKYTIGDVEIVGPYVDLEENIPVVRLTSVPSVISNGKVFVFRPTNSDLFVLQSKIFVYETTIFGPPKSYRDCFKEILNIAYTEHRMAARDKKESLVDAVLRNHKILAYMEQ